MLTLSSSNMTAPTLKTNKHLKKQTNHVFYLHFANSNLKVTLSRFILNIKKKIFHIWNLHKIYVFDNIFHIVMTVKKVAQNPIFLKFLNFYQLNLTVEFFVFSPAGPKTKADQQDSQL